MDDEAFVAFVNARYGALVRFGVLLTGNLDSAEELAQSALLRVYRARRSISDDAEAYVRRTMARLQWRAGKRRWREERPTATPPEIAGTKDDFVGVDDRLALAAALDALPPGQRIVLVLRYWAQLSEAEIADMLGCSPGTVKSRASRALAALRSDAAIAALVGKAMSEVELRDALSDLVADVAPRDLAPGRELLRRARRRARRRRCVASGVVVVLAAAAGALVWTQARPTPSNLTAGGGGAAPSVLTVTCTPTQTQVAQEQVAAAADGVRLKVINRAQGGVAIQYTGAGRSPRMNAGIVIDPPPGNLTVSCVRLDDGSQTPPALVQVVDPHKYWQHGEYRLPECELEAVPRASAPSASGSDPEAAAQSVARSQGLYLGQRQSDGYAEQSPIFFSAKEVTLTRTSIVGSIEAERLPGGKWRATLTALCSVR